MEGDWFEFVSDEVNPSRRELLISIGFVSASVVIYILHMIFSDFWMVLISSIFLLFGLTLYHFLVGVIFKRLREVGEEESISEHFIFIILAHISFYYLNRIFFQFTFDELGLSLFSIFLTYILSMMGFYLNLKKHVLIVDIFSYIIALGISFYLIVYESPVLVWSIFILFVVLLVISEKI